MSNIKMRRQRPINLRLYIVTLRRDYSLIYFSVILKEFLLGRVITGRIVGYKKEEHRLLTFQTSLIAA